MFFSNLAIICGWDVCLHLEILSLFSFIPFTIPLMCVISQLPWPGYQSRFPMDPRIMSHQAAMAAYNLNLRPPASRASPVLYGLSQPSPIGLTQVPPSDKELLQEPSGNGTTFSAAAIV